MATKASAFRPEFVISVGDNFYESKPEEDSLHVGLAMPLGKAQNNSSITNHKSGKHLMNLQLQAA